MYLCITYIWYASIHEHFGAHVRSTTRSSASRLDHEKSSPKPGCGDVAFDLEVFFFGG